MVRGNLKPALTALLCFVLSWMLLSCAASQPPTVSAPAAPSPIPPPDAGDVFEVQAWVDKPNPQPGDQVTLSGSLIKNGAYLGGMVMEGTWPDADQERGVPNCRVLVIYQRGICIIQTAGLASGATLPLHVEFVYGDRVFTGETQFTLR